MKPTPEIREIAQTAYKRRYLDFQIQEHRHEESVHEQALDAALEAARSVMPLDRATVERCAVAAQGEPWSPYGDGTDSFYAEIGTPQNALEYRHHWCPTKDYGRGRDGASAAIRALPVRPLLNPLTEAPEIGARVWIFNNFKAIQLKFNRGDQHMVDARIIFATEAEALECVRRQAEVRGCK